MTAFPLRPFLASDTERLQDLYAQSIEELTADDYDEDQRIAWIERAADAQAFATRLAKAITILVEVDGDILGFASLRETGDNKKREIDMLYVHPYAAGQGVGSALVDAMEKLARARGAEALTVEASDTAQEFFGRRGFQGVRRNTIPVGDVWLTNTTMIKPLVTRPAGSTSETSS
jgi:putative acetyltransferase